MVALKRAFSHCQCRKGQADDDVGNNCPAHSESQRLPFEICWQNVPTTATPPHPQMEVSQGTHCVLHPGAGRNSSSVSIIRHCRSRSISNRALASGFRQWLQFEPAGDSVCICELPTVTHHSFRMVTNVCITIWQNNSRGDTDQWNRLTSFNLAISVLCTFILLVKATMFVLHVWYPLLATVVNLVVTVLWIVSIYGQAGPDHSDPGFPSNSAWYITKSCSYAAPSGNEHYCLMAKGSFAVTVLMAYVESLFLSYDFSNIPRLQMGIFHEHAPRGLVHVAHGRNACSRQARHG